MMEEGLLVQSAFRNHLHISLFLSPVSHVAVYVNECYLSTLQAC